MQLKIHLGELNEKLTLWRGSLKKIEGYYGTGVVSFFLFLKWLIFLNIFISLIMMIFVILPTTYFKKLNATAINTSNKVRDNSAVLLDQNVTNRSEVRTASIQTSSSKFLDLVFDSQSMVTSPLYYAYYNVDFHLDLYYFHFNLPLAYILATIMCLSYSFVSVLKNAAHGFKHQLLENEGQFYAYCNIVFSGWDFCIRNERSAKIKHKALYNEIIGRLNVEKHREERRNRTKREWCKLCMLRIFVNMAVIVFLVIAGFVIFEAFKMSSQKTPTMENWLMKVATEFLTAGSIIFFNLLFPYVFQWLGTFEKFSPLFAVQMTIFRTIMLRLSSLCVLLGSVYEKLLRSRTQTDDEMVSWESYLARELYKVLVLSVLTQIVYTFLFNFPRSLLAKHCNYKVIQYLGRQEFNLPGHVLDVVYIQTIIWLGNFYAPLLPAVGVLTMLIVFYVKKFACLVNCHPASDVFYASRSHSLYISILLISFAFSVVPWVYSITQIPPSKEYGPFVEYSTVWSVIEQMFHKVPDWLSKTARFGISWPIVVLLLIILMLTNYYYYSVYIVNKQMVLILKRQLILEGHDKQFLLNRLSAFIKQQQQRYRPNNSS